MAAVPAARPGPDTLNVAPVIIRELRTESRRPFNYWLRVLGAGTLGVVLLAAVVDWWRPVSASFDPRRFLTNSATVAGAQLFGRLNATIFATIWILFPLITADAISRERRDGTLGLLFLTPLTPAGVVLGKAIVHILRALTVFLALMPWLMVPVLAGGTSWNDFAMASLLNACALLLALAAGLIATSWPRDWARSVMLAEVLSLVFALVFMAAHRVAVERVLASGVPTPGLGRWPGGGTTPRLNPWQAYQHFGHRYTGWDTGWLSDVESLFGETCNNQMFVDFSRSGPSAQPSMVTAWGVVWTNYTTRTHVAWFAAVGGLLAVCAVLFVLAVVLAALRVAGSWREVPEPKSVQALKSSLLKPRFAKNYFRRRMRRALQSNPIGWLQQRTAQARLVKWGWCLLFVAVETSTATRLGDFHALQDWLVAFLLLGLAFSAAGSFRAERESGALELLLVTPLRVRQIIGGRLRGLFMQFLPAALVLVGMPNELYGRQPGGIGWWEPSGVVTLAMLLVAAALAVCTIGLYASLLRVNFLAGWLVTCALGLLLPWFVGLVAPWFLGVIGVSPAVPIETIGIEESVLELLVRVCAQLLLAWLAWKLLNRRLAKREFLLQ